ncbi:MAG: O-antigen ligase family protein [Gaiellaceae bacterium]
MSESLTSQLAAPLSRAFTVGWRGSAVSIGTFATIVALAADRGGYFPTSWNWAALGLAWIAAVALVLRADLTLGRLEIISTGALFLFVGWVALSVAWTDSVTSTVLEAERDVLYPIGLLAAIVVVRRVSVPAFLGGIWAAITIVCWYSLATRIFPDHVQSFDSVGGYRLWRPIGYWNSLGVFAVIGLLLALGFAARGAHAITRALAAASLVVLAPTFYFTYGRGAWIALGCGIVFSLVLDPRRLQLATTLIVTAAPAIVAVILASRLHGLTQVGSSLAQATHDGHRLAVALVILAVVAVVLALARDAVAARFEFGRRTQLAYGATLVAAVLIGLSFAFAHYGAPTTMARRAWHSFNSPGGGGTNLNARLFTLRSNGRTVMWHLAWRDFVHHPVVGAGAGSYEIWYLQHRPNSSKVRDAHSLYMETLAEVGSVGLLLLLVALLAPFVAAFRARGSPLVPAAAGAYFAFLLHTGADWDWEVSAVTLTGLLCGVALLVSARAEGAVVPIRRPGTVLGISVSVIVIGFSLVGLMGNVPASRAGDAIAARNWSRATSEAQKVIRWEPWSAEGWRRLGQAEVGQGKLAASKRDLTKAIRKDPKNWDRWFDLAIATTGPTRRRALEEALALNPHSPEVAEFVAGIGLKGIKPRSTGVP